MDRDTLPPVNPFDPQQTTIERPFAGRTQALMRLHQHMTNPAHTPPVTILGRRKIGKTALLQYLNTLPEANFIRVYVPLRRLNLQTEAIWLRRLSRLMTATIEAHGYLLPEMDSVPEHGEPGRVRIWFMETYLATVFRSVRMPRRIVLLLDDLDAFTKAIEAQTLPEDTFVFLHSLIQPQLAVVATLAVHYEDQPEQFQPLVYPEALYRLTTLSMDDTAALFQPYFQPVDADALRQVYQASGGDPFALQRFGQRLFAIGDFTPQAVKAVMLDIYRDCEADFQRVWKSLSREEQLVLTALASLRYDHPIGELNTADIEAWMVETEYLMDSTAINAALRSLEYQEIVTGQTANIHINGGLLQKWLMENALLGIEAHPRTGAMPQGVSRRTWVIGVVAVVVVIVVLLSLNAGASVVEDDTSIPTITLSGDGED